MVLSAFWGKKASQYSAVAHILDEPALDRLTALIERIRGVYTISSFGSTKSKLEPTS
jgi:hypothetical protein